MILGLKVLMGDTFSLGFYCKRMLILSSMQVRTPFKSIKDENFIYGAISILFKF